MIAQPLTFYVCGVSSSATRQTPGILKENNVDAILNATDI
jgi:hypothetical protein